MFSLFSRCMELSNVFPRSLFKVNISVSRGYDSERQLRTVVHVSEYVISALNKYDAYQIAESNEREMMLLSTAEETDTDTDILTKFVYREVSTEEMALVSRYCETKIIMVSKLL